MKLDLSLSGGEYKIRRGENTIFAYSQGLKKDLGELEESISGEINLPDDMIRIISKEGSYDGSRFETGVRIKFLEGRSMKLSTYVDQAQIDKKLTEAEEILKINSILLPKYTVCEGVKNGFKENYSTSVSFFTSPRGPIKAVGEADLDLLNTEEFGDKIGEINNVPIGYLSNKRERAHYNSSSSSNNFIDSASIIIPSLSFYFNFIGKLGENNKGKNVYKVDESLERYVEDDSIPF